MGIHPDRFIHQPLPDHLLCPVCRTTLDEGVYACESQHATCLPCLSVEGCCPVCQNSLGSIQPATQVIEQVGEHWLRCIDTQCDWIGPASQDKSHALNDCQYRVIACEFCNIPMRYNELVDHLGKVCPEARFFCARGGVDCGGNGNGVFCRKDATLHDSVCSKFSCRVPGCSTMTTLANLPRHETQCFDLRHALVASKRWIAHYSHLQKIHHSNASVLTDTLSSIPRSTLSTNFEKELLKKAKLLYPRRLDYPVSSDLLLVQRCEIDEPVTPITPSAGGGGDAIGLKSVAAPRLHPSSSQSSIPIRNCATEYSQAEAEGIVDDSIGEGVQEPSAKKRKLSKDAGRNGTESAIRGTSPPLFVSPALL